MAPKNSFVYLFAALVAFNFIQAEEDLDIENLYENGLHEETGARTARASSLSSGLNNLPGLSNFSLPGLTDLNLSDTNLFNFTLPVEFGVKCDYAKDGFASCSCSQAIRCFPTNIGYAVKCDEIKLGCNNGHCSIIAALKNSSDC